MSFRKKEEDRLTMAAFEVWVQRVYAVRESTVVEIEASTPEEAIRQAKKLEVDAGFDDWWENGGSVERDSYRWMVTDHNGVTLATSTGAYDTDYSLATNSNAPGQRRNGL